MAAEPHRDVEVFTANLRGKLKDVGPVKFTLAEWWDTAPRTVLLRYSVDGHDSPKGLRLDLDKAAILDSLEDDGIRDGREWDAVIQDRRREIRDVVVEERKRVMFELALHRDAW